MIFTIDSRIFADLRATPNISVAALNRLVAAANENIVLNVLLTEAAQADDLTIRLARAGELPPDASGLFNPTKEGGRYTILLNPEFYTGTAVPGSTNIGIFGHELDH